MYIFVDQFNFHDSFTELGLTGRLALQKWDMSVSVVVVVTVLLILSDFCRLLSASNPVWLWDLFLYIRKKRKNCTCIWNEKCMKTVFCFLVYDGLFYFSAIFENASIEYWWWICHLVTAIVNVFIVWMTAPFFSLASLYPVVRTLFVAVSVFEHSNCMLSTLVLN